MNIAPPSVESLFITEFEVKVESVIATLLPVRQIAPPLELELPSLIPVFSVNLELLILPLLPSQ